MSWAYSEQHLVQEPAANWLEAQGWKTVLAFDAEDFGPNSLLGRADKKVGDPAQGAISLEKSDERQ